MAKVRVYELAREFNIDGKEMATRLKTLGYDIKNYMSALDEEIVNEARRYLSITAIADVAKEFKMDIAQVKEITDVMNQDDRTRLVIHSNFRMLKIIGAIKTYQKLKESLEIKAKDVTSIELQTGQWIQSDEAKVPKPLFLIDGLNVCRAYPQENRKASFEALLSIIIEITNRGASFMCIFDANTSFILRDEGSPGTEEIYNNLRQSLPKHFCEATGRTRADDYILMQSDQSGNPIISNNKFISYIDRYGWIQHETARLIKGKIMGNKVMIPDLNLNIPVRKDMAKMVNELIETLGKK
jgi:hypothetical protein